MNIESTSKGIVYGYFTFSRVDKNNVEVGTICINVIKPLPVEDGRHYGWEATSYYVPFSDELFKYLKTTLIKQSEFKFRLVQDYKNSNNYICQLIGINDFVIKQ